MNYTLRFVPIFDYSPIAGLGFAGNLMMVVNILLHVKSNLWVDAKTYKTMCCDNIEDNSWDYLFIQKNSYQKNSILIENDKGYDEIIKYQGNYAHNDSIILKAKELFMNNFQIKNEILNKVNEYYNEHLKNKVTLACQIRLGDMAKNHKVAGIDIYEKNIKQILTLNPNIKQVFIASDDEDAIKYISDNINVPVLYQYNIHRDTSADPYSRVFDERENHNSRLCREVLKDILLLGKCDYFLKADRSSVSTAALVFSENIKKTYSLNGKR